VRSTDGGALAGIDLRLRRGVRTVARTTSSADGRFVFEGASGPAQGAWQVYVEPGSAWEARPRSVRVPEDSPAEIEFTLVPRGPSDASADSQSTGPGNAEGVAPGDGPPGGEWGGPSATLELNGPAELPRDGWLVEAFAEHGSGWADHRARGRFIPANPARVEFPPLGADTDVTAWRIALTSPDGLWFASGRLEPNAFASDRPPHLALLVNGRGYLDVVGTGDAARGRIVHATPLDGPAEAWLAAGAGPAGRPAGGVDLLLPEEGRAALGPLAAGPWLVWLEHDGMLSAPRRIEVEPGARREIWLP